MKTNNTIDLIAFLSAISKYDGGATTTQIRLETGLSNSDVHYRYTVAEERGLITVDRAGSPNESNRAHLTEDGYKLVNNTTAKDEVSSEEVQLNREEYFNLIERIETVEEKQTAFSSELKRINKGIYKYLLCMISVLSNQLEYEDLRDDVDREYDEMIANS
jgi:hypothetical protein